MTTYLADVDLQKVTVPEGVEILDILVDVNDAVIEVLKRADVTVKMANATG